MRSLIILAALASARPAAATPIEPLWETKVACERTELVPWGNSLAWLAGTKVQRIDRATGKLAAPLALAKLTAPKGPAIGWSDAASLEAVVGDALVIHGGHFFAVVDAATGALRWQADQGHDAGLPTLRAIDGDVFWIHASSLNKGDAVAVERLAIATGKSMWKTSAMPDSGQREWNDTDGKRLYVLTRPDAIGPKNFLAAFDVATGKRLWSKELTGKAHDQGSGGTKGLLMHRFGSSIVYSTGETPLHVLDGATGGPLPDVPLPAPAQGLVSDATHLYALTENDLTAIDMVKHAAKWTQRRDLDRVLAATPAAVYAVSHHFQILHALDPRTGVEVASWGVTGTELAYTAADGAAPVFVACDDGKRLLALDPSGAPRATERATITGTLVCKGCRKGKKFFPPTDVTLGDARARTDARGRFKIEIESRGALELQFGLPEIDSPLSWEGATRAVQLRGKRKYALGTITARLDCGPIEPPCL